MAAMKSWWIIAMLIFVQPPAGADATADYSTPESTLQTFNAAWERRDIDAILDAQDFMFEAESWLKSDGNPDPKAEDVRDLADALKTAIRREIPNVALAEPGTQTCTISAKESISPDLVRLVESCSDVAGHAWKQSVLVAHRENGWRLVSLQNQK